MGALIETLNGFLLNVIGFKPAAVNLVGLRMFWTLWVTDYPHSMVPKQGTEECRP